MASPFTTPGINPATGTLYSLVWTGNTGASGYTFVYYLAMNASVGSAEGLTLNNFAGFTVGVGLSGNGGGAIEATQVTRSLDGSTLNFSFPLTLTGNAVGDWLIVDTSANTYVTSAGSVQDGQAASGLAAYAPATLGVPDGGMTIGLFGMALMAVEALRRRLSK